ncbi:phosphatase [Rhodoblastus sphagnicola]|uniref:Phosphatase n=1 Tax=Rhodoblastus sphagnicola TaxID=333368 RepID=A0A2S6NEV0_9HYPH|nr:HAD-IA family hydrolase [Rhodoblastus sphagnicola]MBB4196425.1 HAD superfamily hydrolase (TIGR01509 family) [Rhodoblastus sphagnicola]PPQ33133.1 phosphatase [Rhodoblastus sphagnicola]
MIKAVIFDVDGTLAETEEVHRIAFNRAFADAGLDWDWDRDLYRQLLKVTGGKERMAHFVQESGAPPLPPERIAALHKAKTDFYTRMADSGEILLRPGVEEFLDALREKGVKLAIATTTSLPNIEALLSSALGPQWRARFVAVAAGDMVAAKKPAPDVYQLALRQLDLPAAACVAVEDSRNGLRSAKAAGLRVIAVRSAYCADDDLSGADVTLADCEGLTLEVLARF